MIDAPKMFVDFLRMIRKFLYDFLHQKILLKDSKALFWSKRRGIIHYDNFPLDISKLS
jgi:hypothetical protein